MSPQEKLYKPEYAAELLSIASGDLASARGLYKIDEGRRENIAFLVQQVIEKSVKAVLCRKKIPVPLAHDMGALVAKLPATAMPPQGYALNELNEYATVRRYEEGRAELTREEISRMLATAEAVLGWAKKS